MPEIPHGTLSRYTNKKCRCDACRAASQAYQQMRKDRIAAGLPARVEREEDWRVVHGSKGRVKSGCECGICSAEREKIAAEKEAKRAERMEAAHGTRNGYLHYKCRCELCVAANRDHARQRHANLGEKEIPDHVHGTRNGYVNYECRCEDCKKAGAEANKSYYDRTYVKKRS